MKKLVGIIAVLLCAGIAFAQNTNAAELLKKAKNYEAEKKWVYAICTYYDVLQIDANNSEAASGYKKFVDAIESGKPGLGEYNEFQLRDGWFALRREWEKYWTENCPFRFELGYPKKGDVNYEKKTATYSVTYKTLCTKKFIQIIEIFATGIEKSHRKDWGFEWSAGFVFSEKDGDPLQIYQKYGVATIKYTNKPTYSSVEISFEDYEIYKGKDSGTSTRSKEGEGALYIPSAFSISKYELEVCICDSDGKILATKKDYLSSHTRYIKEFVFENLNSSIMEKIDSGRCSVKVNSAQILYGTMGWKVTEREKIPFYGTITRYGYDESGLKKLKIAINPEENENNPIKELRAALLFISNNKVYGDGFRDNFKYKNLSRDDISKLYDELVDNEYVQYSTYTPNVAAAKAGEISNPQQLVDKGYTKIAVHPTKGNKLAIKNSTYDQVELDFWSVEKENKSKGKNHLAKGKSIKINSRETYSGNPLSDKFDNLTEFYVKALRYTGIQIVDTGTDGKNQTLLISGTPDYPSEAIFLVLSQKGKEFLQNSQAK